MKMKELPFSERPYEKLEIYGAEKLSNAELLAIIIKTGTKDKSVLSIAQEIINMQKDTNTNSLRFLQEMTVNDFMKIKGIGKIKAIQLLSICELTKRISKPINQKIIIKNSKDVADLLMPEMRYEKKEKVKVLLLNSKNVLIKTVDISLGGANFAYIEPKDILMEAIKNGAPKIILIHNHPSGDVTPSKNDHNVTTRVYEAANLMGIDFLDHIIIGDGKFLSIFRKD